MFHVHLDYFQEPPLGGRPNTKPSGDHGTLNAHNCRFILLYRVWGPAWIEMHWNSIWLRHPVTYDFTLDLRIRDHTTWCWRCVGTAFGHFSFGLSQFHGHGSWLVCEVAQSRSGYSFQLIAVSLCTSWRSIIGRFSGISGWDPSACKSNRLHVHILRFSFIKLGGYIL